MPVFSGCWTGLKQLRPTGAAVISASRMRSGERAIGDPGQRCGIIAVRCKRAALGSQRRDKTMGAVVQRIVRNARVLTPNTTSRAIRTNTFIGRIKNGSMRSRDCCIRWVDCGGALAQPTGNTMASGELNSMSRSIGPAGRSKSFAAMVDCSSRYIDSSTHQWVSSLGANVLAMRLTS